MAGPEKTNVISCDTNILYLAVDRQSPREAAARAFLNEHADNQDFCLCEQALMELYVLLRNPAISKPSLSPKEAVEIVHRLRSNPAWRIVDVPGKREIMDDLWGRAAARGFAGRRIFDLRMALTLRHHGVTQFATRNTKDFQGLGFRKVWDPTA